MYSKESYREDRLEGLSIERLPPISFRSRKEKWGATVAKMYVASLRTGEVPNYPSEPELIVLTGWVR